VFVSKVYNLDMEIKGIKAKLFQCPYTLLHKWMSKEMKSKGEIPLEEFISKIRSIQDFDVVYVTGINVQKRTFPETLFVKAYNLKAWNIVDYLLTNYSQSLFVVYSNISCLSNILNYLVCEVNESEEDIPETAMELKIIKSIVERYPGLVNLGIGSLFVLLFGIRYLQWTKTIERIASILVRNGAQLKEIPRGLRAWKNLQDYYNNLDKCSEFQIFPGVLSCIIIDYVKHPLYSIFSPNVRECAFPDTICFEYFNMHSEEIFEDFVKSMWPEVPLDREILDYKPKYNNRVLKRKIEQ
jgi:hypothetical protein